MKKLSIQKLSLLGLILMAASVVAAAVLPSNNKSASKFDAQGSITATSEPGKIGSCTATNSIQTPCNNTHSCGPEDVSGSSAPSCSIPTSEQTTAGDLP